MGSTSVNGSGNAGTTNMQVRSDEGGAITLLGDAFKCVIAVLVVRMLFCRKISGYAATAVDLYTAAGVVLGHNFLAL